MCNFNYMVFYGFFRLQKELMSLMVSILLNFIGSKNAGRIKKCEVSCLFLLLII